MDPIENDEGGAVVVRVVASASIYITFWPATDTSSGIEITNTRNARRFEVKSPVILRILSFAAAPIDRKDLVKLAQSPQLRTDLIERLVDELLRLQFLEDAPNSETADIWPYYNWEVPYLHHQMARAEAFLDTGKKAGMEVRESVVADYRKVEPFPFDSYEESDSDIRLPRGETNLHWPTGAALLNRKTLRTWQWRVFRPQELANLLWYGLRPIGENRAVIENDSRFEHCEGLLTHYAHIGIWVLPIRVDTIAPAIYRYDPVRHSLAFARSYGTAESLEGLCVGQVPLRDASVIIVMTGRFDEFSWRYRHNRAYRVMFIELGEMMQNIILAGTAMKMRPFITPALRDREFDALLGTDGYTEGVLYMAAFG